MKMNSSERMSNPNITEDGVDVDPNSFISQLKAQEALSHEAKAREESLSDEEALERIKQILAVEIPNQERLILELETKLRKALELLPHQVLSDHHPIPAGSQAEEINNDLKKAREELSKLQAENENLRDTHPAIHDLVVSQKK